MITMKRFGWALALAAAWLLVCTTVWAADAPALSTAVGHHIWLTLIGGLLPPLIKAFNEGTLNLPTVPARYRLLLIAVLSGIATAAEMVGNGGAWPEALMALAIAAGPSLLIEAVHARWGGWKGATVTEGPKSSDGGPGPKLISVPPPRQTVTPPPLPTTLKMATLVIAMGALPLACAAICPTIKLASDICPIIMVELPDGSLEPVPKAQITGLAVQSRAMRTAPPRDAGPE